MEHRDDERIAAAERRRQLSAFAASLAGNREEQRCGRKIRKGKPGSSTEVLTVPAWCHMKWLCPTCGFTAARRGAVVLERRLQRWGDHGGATTFLTLGQSHQLNDPLADLWGHLDRGWKAITTGSGWLTIKESHGIRGYERITEVAHNPRTGWNPHFHAVLFHGPQWNPASRERLRVAMAARFVRGVRGSGGRADVDRQDLRPVSRGTERGLARYLLKGTTEHNSDGGSRTPLAVLGRLHDSGEGCELWQEFSAAASPPARRKQIVASQRLDDLLPSVALSPVLGK